MGIKKNTFKRNLLAASISSCMLASAGVHSQELDTATIEEVVVTGIKSSLERSLDIKRESSQIVEAITADEIGKMPDQNIAESLQRLPGVQIDRSAGEGTRVRIRGLGNNITLLNGETFVSGMEHYQMGEGRTQFEASLEGVPSELLGGVEVFKTPKASNVEGGVGGVINLKTRNPLELKSLLIAGNVKADRGSDAGETKPSGTLVLGGSFSETFAAILSVSMSQKTVHSDEAQNLNRNSFGFKETAAGETYVVPGMQYETDKEYTRERIGSSLALAWAPTDALEVSLDWFHGDLEIDDRSYSMKYTLNTDGGALIEDMPYSIDANHILVSGNFTTSGENNGYRDITTISNDNVRLGFDLDNGGKWRFDGSLSYASGDMEKNAAFGDSRYQPYNVITANPASATGWSSAPANAVAGDTGARYTSFNQSGTGLPTNTLSPAAAAAVNNSANFVYKSHWAYGDRSDISSTALSANAEVDIEFGDIKTIRFGFRTENKETDFTEGHYLANLGDSSILGQQGVGVVSPDGHNLGDIDGDGISDDQVWGSYYRYIDAGITNPAFGVKTSDGSDLATLLYGVSSGRWDGNPSPIGTVPWRTYDQAPDLYTQVNGFFPSGGSVSTALFTDPAEMSDPAAWLSKMAGGAPVDFIKDKVESWNVELKTTALYVEADLEGDDVPYTLNVGVRLVRSEVTTSGGQTTPNDIWYGTDSWNGPVDVQGTFSKTKSYTDILPSLNFSLETSESQKVRFSLARVMSRPSEQSLGKGANYNFTRNDARGGYEFVNGTVGNPELDPFRATQSDVSYEIYSDDSLSYASGGVFLKVVDTFEAGISTPTRVSDSTTEGSTIGQINSTENGTGGSVKGFELALQKGWDSGLGVTFNYTYSDSTTDLSSYTHKDLPLPGVSKNSFNVIGFYEANGFQARIAYTWRDEYLSPDQTLETIAAGGSVAEAVNFASFYDAYNQIDASVKYDITDSFTVFAEAINITGESQNRYIEYKNFFRSYMSGEPRFALGVNFSF